MGAGLTFYLFILVPVPLLVPVNHLRKIAHVTEEVPAFGVN